MAFQVRHKTNHKIYTVLEVKENKTGTTYLVYDKSTNAKTLDDSSNYETLEEAIKKLEFDNNILRDKIALLTKIIGEIGYNIKQYDQIKELDKIKMTPFKVRPIYPYLKDAPAMTVVKVERNSTGIIYNLIDENDKEFTDYANSYILVDE